MALRKICLELDFSADYLLGLSDNPKSHKNEKIAIDPQVIEKCFAEMQKMRRQYDKIANMVVQELYEGKSIPKN